MLRVYESHNFARSIRTLDLQYAGESSSKTFGNHLLDQSQSYGGTMCYIKTSNNCHLDNINIDP